MRSARRVFLGLILLFVSCGSRGQNAANVSPAPASTTIQHTVLIIKDNHDHLGPSRSCLV